MSCDHVYRLSASMKCLRDFTILFYCESCCESLFYCHLHEPSSVPIKCGCKARILVYRVAEKRRVERSRSRSQEKRAMRQASEDKALKDMPIEDDSRNLGSYSKNRSEYTKLKDANVLTERYEIDHQPARQVYTGKGMTRKESEKRGLVRNEPSFGVPTRFHRKHITTGRSKASEKFRSESRTLLLSGQGGRATSGTRLDVEQLALVDYASMSDFQKFTASNTPDTQFVRDTFRGQGGTPLSVVYPDGTIEHVTYKPEHQELRDLAFKCAITGKWPIEELEALNNKIEKNKVD